MNIMCRSSKNTRNKEKKTTLSRSVWKARKLLPKNAPHGEVSILLVVPLPVLNHHILQPHARKLSLKPNTNLIDLSPVIVMAILYSSGSSRPPYPLYH